jgi:hypothetical protein
LEESIENRGFSKSEASEIVSPAAQRKKSLYWDFFIASYTLRSKQAIVTGPTPPGTGDR